MFKIGDVQFSTREEAEDWAYGNIGGLYSIESLTFCHTCSDWEGADWKAENQRCEVCGAVLGADGEFHGGNKALARIGLPYWKMQATHPMYELRCWVFGFPVQG